MELVDVYYLAFPKDRRLLKLAVIWVYLVGAAQTILAMADLNTGIDDNQGSDVFCFPLGHFWLTVIVFSTPGEDLQVLILSLAESTLIIISGCGSPMALCL
jgi:hypothetical protein